MVKPSFTFVSFLKLSTNLTYSLRSNNGLLLNVPKSKFQFQLLMEDPLSCLLSVVEFTASTLTKPVVRFYF